MSYLNCYLAAEKEKDGKPFTVCIVDTYFNVGVHMLKEKDKKTQAKALYKQFGTGKDKSERGVTMEELLPLSKESNGGIYLIPKSADKFVKIGV